MGLNWFCFLNFLFEAITFGKRVFLLFFFKIGPNIFTEQGGAREPVFSSAGPRGAGPCGVGRPCLVPLSLYMSLSLSFFAFVVFFVFVFFFVSFGHAISPPHSDQLS